MSASQIENRPADTEVLTLSLVVLVMGKKYQVIKAFLAGFKMNVKERIEKFHWYPSSDELAEIPVEELLSLRRDIAKSIMGSTFTLLGFGAFCILALESPDSLLLSEMPAVKLPFVGSQVSLTGFLIAGPILIFGMWMYLNILFTYHRRLWQALCTREYSTIPTVAQLKHPFLKLLVGLTFFFLVPVVMLSATYKAMAIPGYGIVMFSVTLFVVWVHILSLSRWLRHRVQMALVVAGSVLITITGYVSWDNPEVFVRPYSLFRADLSRAFLPNKDLRKIYAARANLKGAVLIGADLRGAYFGNTDLQGADLSRADLRGAYLGWADIREADLTNADLRNAQLINVDARQTVLISAQLQGAILSGVNFENAYLQGALFDRAQITNADFKNAIVNRASFKKVQIQGLFHRNSINQAIGVSQAQLADIAREALSQPTPIYDSHGNIAGWDDPRGEINAWESLPEPGSAWDEFAIVSRAGEKFPDLLPGISKSENRSWQDWALENTEDSGDIIGGDKPYPGHTEYTWKPDNKKRPPESWDQLLNGAENHKQIRQWLLKILKDPKEKLGARKEALTVLLLLNNPKAATEAYTNLLAWSPSVPADVRFNMTTVRKYLILYALRNNSLSDEFAMDIVKKAHGARWQEFLKNLLDQKSFHGLTEAEKETERFTKQRAAKFLEILAAR